MTAAGILARIAERTALVVGDICVDRWCTYDPALGEPSRETGLPRVAVTKTVCTAGAGGTVANNLAALGVRRVAVLGVVGDDGHGYELRQALQRSRIDATLLVTAEVPTFTYTKLLNARTGEEDLSRVDYVNEKPLGETAERAVLDQLDRHAAEFDVVLVSDQAETTFEGVVTARVRQWLSAFALAHPEKLVWVDSRMRAELFRHVLVKPNEREAREACARLGGVTLAELRRRIQAPLLMVTHGGEGVLLLNEHGETWVKTEPVPHPVDICGAGDSFSAGAALAMSSGVAPGEAARFGNYVASVTIMKRGTGTASPEEVLAAERSQRG
jgi:rfaE bifunctional protein kinase chain/domain